MPQVILSSTGLMTPKEQITNEELVQSFNQYVDEYNNLYSAKIKRGEIEPLQKSDVSFIYKASGIRNRFVLDKQGILNTDFMHPLLPKRNNEEISYQVEMALVAAKDALRKTNLEASQLDAVLMACSNFERPYPALSIELQHALGIQGFAFDLNVACSSATFGIKTACDMIKSGSCKRVLVVNPEICSAHLNFRDRDSHFIFGDACTAVILEACPSKEQLPSYMQLYGYEIIDGRLETSFSNNIRNNFGLLQRCHRKTASYSTSSVSASQAFSPQTDQLFVQQGRKVFKEVTPKVANMIKNQLRDLNYAPQDLKKIWLHQANKNMNKLILEKLFGSTIPQDISPNTLEDYANTSSAGSVIAFHKHQEGIKSGDLGLLCSFGAGYSLGSIVMRKL